ncbi:MAG: F0F1 ATP synthase subunit A [Elusimicrobiaceae bacterium]|nr:F0F1 ATP synthase subunit A [Elusimicrobiaceae bacterium]
MEVSQTIAHHILDHDFGVMLGTIHLPLTAHTVTMFCISIILLLTGWLLSRQGKSVFARLMRTAGEEYVGFMRDGIVIPGMGVEGKTFLSYFCTLFLFILFSNLAGLIPEVKTITSNISVTGGLALCSGALIVYCGIKFHGPVGFIKTFVPGGTPWWLVPLIFPLEVISLLIRVCVLAIRLFANMLSGHMVLLSLLLIVFIIGQMSKIAGVGSAIPAMGLEIFMTFLELLVAFLQAYVFTLLTSIYVGLVIHSH